MFSLIRNYVSVTDGINILIYGVKPLQMIVQLENTKKSFQYVKIISIYNGIRNK